MMREKMANFAFLAHTLTRGIQPPQGRIQGGGFGGMPPLGQKMWSYRPKFLIFRACGAYRNIF